MELVGKPCARTVKDILASLVSKPLEEVLIATAYMNKKGFNLMKEVIEKAKSTKIVVCLDPRATDPEALEEILKNPLVKCRCYKSSSNRYFHPKMYIFKHGDDEYSVLIGSSNLTYNGLTENIEANIYFEKFNYPDAKDFINFFDKVYEDGIKLTKEVLRDFVEIRTRYIKKYRELKNEISRTKLAEYYPSERILDPRSISKIKKIMLKEKDNFIKYFKTENDCKNRSEYVLKVKNFALKEEWVELLSQIWSIGGLKRGALVRSSVIARICKGKSLKNAKEIAKCLVEVNGLSKIKTWIKYIQNKDWEKASKIHLHGIGEKIQSELFCLYHGDEYGIKNKVSIKALEILLGNPADFGYKSYHNMPYTYFNSILREIVQIYLETIGRLCDEIPLLLELDAFFWYLYETKIKHSIH